MRLGRLPQNSFDRLTEKALPPIKAGRRMTVPMGVSVMENGEAAITVSMIINDAEDARVCFYKSLTALKCAPAKPKALLLAINARRRDSESQIKNYLQLMDDLCRKHGMTLFPASIQTLGDQRTFTLTALGQSEVAYAPKAGDYVCMAGHAGASGTLCLIKACAEQLKERFSEGWLEAASRNMVTDCDDIFPLLADGQSFMQPVSEGGVFAALWDMKSMTGTGFDIDQLMIPFRQETIEICDYLGINPYQLSGDGGMLIVCESPEKLKASFDEAGVPFNILGRLTKEKACTLHKKDESTCLDRPDIDGIWQIYNK